VLSSVQALVSVFSSISFQLIISILKFLYVTDICTIMKKAKSVLMATVDAPNWI
jgi:hypothetical protein